MRSAARWGPERGGERDLIEAGLNEAVGTMAIVAKCGLQSMLELGGRVRAEGGLFAWAVGGRARYATRFLVVEDAIDVAGGAPVLIYPVRPIGDQAAVGDERTVQ